MFLLLIDSSTLHNDIKIFSADSAALHVIVFDVISCLTFSVGLPLWKRMRNQPCRHRHIGRISYRDDTFGANGDTFLKTDYLRNLLDLGTCAAIFVYAGLYGKPDLQALSIAVILAILL